MEPGTGMVQALRGDAGRLRKSIRALTCWSQPAVKTESVGGAAHIGLRNRQSTGDAIVLRIIASMPEPAPAGCGDTHEPPGGDVRDVGEAVRFADCHPHGRLAASVTILPMGLAGAPAVVDLMQATRPPIGHVDVRQPGGHPGAAEPHDRVILRYVAPDQAPKAL